MPSKSKKNFNRILKFLSPYKFLAVFTVITTLLMAIISPIRPLIIGYVIDKFVMKAEKFEAALKFLNSINDSNFELKNGFLYWIIIAVITIIIEAILKRE